MYKEGKTHLERRRRRITLNVFFSARHKKRDDSREKGRLL
jgi:hypothetical protein